MPQILHESNEAGTERVGATQDTLELVSGLSGTSHVRLCRECGGVFTTENTRRVYCSNACRQKSYRKRVEIAKSFEEWMKAPWYKRFWYWLIS